MNLAFSKTPKTGFFATRPILLHSHSFNTHTHYHTILVNAILSLSVSYNHLDLMIVLVLHVLTGVEAGSVTLQVHLKYTKTKIFAKLFACCRVPKEIQKHNSMIFHDQQSNFHAYLCTASNFPFKRHLEFPSLCRA